MLGQPSGSLTSVFCTKTKSFLGTFQLIAVVYTVSSHPDNLIYLIFQPLEVVSRYRDSQPQVAENYSYLFRCFVKLKKIQKSEKTS